MTPKDSTQRSEARLGEWIAIAIGGAIGASLRFGLTRIALHVAPASLWWATAASNLIGAFLLGAFLARVDDEKNPLLRPFLATGVLGSFTTFSTLLLENSGFFAIDSFQALSHLGLSIGVGLLGFAAGEALGKPRPRRHEA